MKRFENALISRSISHLNDDEVLIDEKWDLNHPDCPFVSYPSAIVPYQEPGRLQTVMHAQEFARYGMKPVD